MTNSLLQRFKIDAHFLVAIVVVFTSWTIYYSLPYSWLFHLLVFVWIVSHHKNNPKKQSLFIAFLILSLWYYRLVGAEISIPGIIKSLLISSLFLLDDDVLCGIIYHVKNIVCFIVAIGVVLHVLRTFGGISLPEITTVYAGDRYFHVYPFVVYQYEVDFRFNSIFDEAGYLGTLSSFFIILDGYNLKSIRNIILIIGGVFTLSFAFIVIMLFGLFAFSVKRKSIVPLIIVLSIVCLVFWFVPELSDIFAMRQDIFSVGSDGFSDSRGGAEQMRENLDIIFSRSWYNILLGNGYNAHLLLFKANDISIASSSIFRLIFQIGFLGVAYLILFIIVNSKSDFVYRIFTLCFILSLYQRPHIFEPIFIVLLALATSKHNYRKILKK